MKTKTHARFLALVAALLSPGLAAADDLSLQLQRTGRPSVFYHTLASPASSLNFSISGALGFGSASVSYGGVDLDLTAITPATPSISTGGFVAASATINQSFTISTDPGLNGAQGTIVLSTRLSGGFAWNISGYASFSVNGNNGGLFYPNTIDPQPANSTLTSSFPISFSSIGSAVSVQTHVIGDASANRPDAGYPDGHNHVDLSVRTGAIKVLNSTGDTVNFTSSSATGTARGSNVPSGSSYTGFSLANTTGHSTTLSLLDGTANAANYVEAAFLSSPHANAGLQAFSDAVDFTGTGSDKFVLQLSFDEAAVLAAGLTDLDLHMEWLDPITGAFKDAFMGDSDGGAAHQFFAGSYLGGAEFQLGNYGVDLVNHVLWAVVDHNSEFVVAQIVPEPSTWVIMLGGVGMFAGCRRFGRTRKA